MQLAIEQAHLNLDESHKAFSIVIDDFEDGCQANFHFIKEKKTELFPFPKKINKS